MDQHPGVVLESVNYWRTCWSPLNPCTGLLESYLWQLPASEKGIKVASQGYDILAFYHFQGCELRHIRGMRHYLPLSVLMSSECSVFKNRLIAGIGQYCLECSMEIFNSIAITYQIIWTIHTLGTVVISTWKSSTTRLPNTPALSICQIKDVFGWS